MAAGVASRQRAWEPRRRGRARSTKKTPICHWHGSLMRRGRMGGPENRRCEPRSTGLRPRSNTVPSGLGSVCTRGCLCKCPAATGCQCEHGLLRWGALSPGARQSRRAPWTVKTENGLKMKGH